MSETKQEAESDVSCEADTHSMKKKDVLSITASPWRRDEGVSALPGQDTHAPMPSKEEQGYSSDGSKLALPTSPCSRNREDSGYEPSPSPAGASSAGSLTPRDRHFQFGLGALSNESRKLELPRFRTNSCTSIEEEDETVDEGLDSGDDDADEVNVVFDLNSSLLEQECGTQCSMTQPEPSTSNLYNKSQPISIPTTTQSAPTQISDGDGSNFSPVASAGSHSFPGVLPHRHRVRSTPAACQSFRLQVGCYVAHRSDLSSPRRSISTQTPNQHCQMIQHAIRWHSGQSSNAAQQQPPGACVIARGRAVQMFRIEGDEDDDKICDDDSFPLPDEILYHRNRSRSEPAVPAWQRIQTERQFGQELRRISDEFHDLYISAAKDREQNMPRPSSYPGTRGGVARPFWQSLWRYFSRQPPSPVPEQTRRRPRSQSTSSLCE